MHDTGFRIRYVKAKIHDIKQQQQQQQQETINHIISECSKLAHREYKTRHDCVSKVVYWEMSKKFRFDHTNK